MDPILEAALGEFRARFARSGREPTWVTVATEAAALYRIPHLSPVLARHLAARFAKSQLSALVVGGDGERIAALEVPSERSPV